MSYDDIYEKTMRPHLAAAVRRVYGPEEGALTCERCGAGNAERNRQRTNYHNDEENYATLCPACQEEADEYWDEMWREYYQNCM